MIPSLTHTSLPQPHTVHTFQSFVCVCLLLESISHSLTSLIPRTFVQLFLCTLPFCTSLSLPGAPASLTTHLTSSPVHPSTPIHIPILLPLNTLPFLGHSPPFILPQARTLAPASGDTCSCRAGRGCAAAATSPALPLPAPPLPSSLTGSPAPAPPAPPARRSGGVSAAAAAAAGRSRHLPPPSARAELSGSRSGTAAKRTAMGGGPAAGGSGRVTPGARPAPDPDPRGAAP